MALAGVAQGAHKTKTIPHCYVVRGGAGGGGSSGVVEWHGHPARLEAALCYLLDEDEEKEEEGAAAASGGEGVGPQEVPIAVPVGE